MAFPKRANEMNVKKPQSMLFLCAAETGANMPLDMLPILGSWQVSVLAVAEMVLEAALFSCLFCPLFCSNI